MTSSKCPPCQLKTSLSSLRINRMHFNTDCRLKWFLRGDNSGFDSQFYWEDIYLKLDWIAYPKKLLQGGFKNFSKGLAESVHLQALRLWIKPDDNFAKCGAERWCFFNFFCLFDDIEGLKVGKYGFYLFCWVAATVREPCRTCRRKTVIPTQLGHFC